MATVTERIQELRRRRNGRYYDLVREAGKNSGAFIDDDLRELDEVALLLGKSQKVLTDDLNAAARLHALTRQLADAEDQKPAADRNITKLDGRIKQAVVDRNEASDARNVAKRRCDGEAARSADAAYNVALSAVSRLQGEAKTARKPVAACMMLPKLIGDLVTLNPWLRECVGVG